jgi:hypothetical protein
VIGANDCGHTSAWSLVDDPHGHGLPVHDHVTGCELDPGAGVTVGLGVGLAVGVGLGVGVGVGLGVGVAVGSVSTYQNEDADCTLTTSPAANDGTVYRVPVDNDAAARCEPCGNPT